MLETPHRELAFADAIREAFDQAMDADQNVILIGEGVPDPKAIFTTTEGLQKKFGPKRVFDMPLSENGMTGVCIGAALTGMRPVLIHQRIDFALLSMDQLVNNAAKWHYMFNGKASVPLVVRMIVGRGWGQGPQHSQSLQSMFAQVPGLKVIMPTTAHDAKGMMIAAIEDDNPVMFIEHRWLHHITSDVPETPYRVPLDKANVMIEGEDITIAAFSHMAIETFIAAKALSTHLGVNCEVLDMRSVRPLDVEAVLKSVRKTGHLLVADTAFQTGSISSELICQVVEHGFDALKASPSRLTMPDHPVPTSPHMTENYYPGPKDMVHTIMGMLGIDRDGIKYAALMQDLERQGFHDVPNREFTGPF